MLRAHVIIDGRVQGVFFRQSTYEEARRLGVNGWVRNRRDGTVEAVFEGEDDPVREMVEWCRQGPPYAIVRSLDLEWEDYQGDFDEFKIRY